jgi:hypothetical protein
MAQDDAGPAGQATDAQLCPLCATLAALRQARPEAVEHLVKAGAEILLAAKALLEGAAEPAPGPGSRRRAHPAGVGNPAHTSDGLQRIDIG